MYGLFFLGHFLVSLNLIYISLKMKVTNVQIRSLHCFCCKNHHSHVLVIMRTLLPCSYFECLCFRPLTYQRDWTLTGYMLSSRATGNTLSSIGTATLVTLTTAVQHITYFYRYTLQGNSQLLLVKRRSGDILQQEMYNGHILTRQYSVIFC